MTPIEGWIEATGLPAGVRGGTATRRFDGVSEPPYGRANYGEQCGDQPVAVARNRALLRESLGLAREPLWLRQVHGTAVVVLESSGASSALHGQSSAAPVADACLVHGSGLAAAVLTADCLPILLAAEGSDEVAAIHAGWRGLAAGVIEATLARMNAATASIRAWLGPAIGQDAFEVGPEVRAAFVDADPGAAACFRRGRDDRWHADLADLARRRLLALGVTRISGGDFCTVEDPASFHSFRRDGVTSGRMATLVWRSP
ncbi:MAG TPA: peptidoglycan editing factor PgeF [Xanthomonadales bacterium]|nr:peptidoglycan editing factor PgeF [Xanthomonadales bacterium]